jgi:predicted dehydrogenase
MQRRGFLRVATSSVALSALSPMHYRRVLGANARIGIGFIGYGLIGSRHVADFLRQPTADLLAISEVHRARLEQGLAQLGRNDAKGYGDFRKLLDDPRIQGVVISTPDHWHALQTMLACDAGKDVYVEKPMTLFQREGQWIQQVAARTKRIVQVGTQQRSGLHYQRAKDIIQSGGIGKVHSIRMVSHRNISPGFGTVNDSQPPVDLDWDMWLGPAPFRPYNRLRSIYHFRWYWDYAGGQMTNLGAHHLDIVDWICGLSTLKYVASVGGKRVLKDQSETPDTQDSLFDLGDITIHYSIREASGSLGTSNAANTNNDRKTSNPSPWGLEFAGSEGQLSINRSGFRVVGDWATAPENFIPGIGKHPAGGPESPSPTSTRKQRVESFDDTTGSDTEQFENHARNFLDCIVSRNPPHSDLTSGHRTATACHLANISLRLGRAVRWDANAESVADDAEANAMLVRAYREPWQQQRNAVLRTT